MSSRPRRSCIGEGPEDGNIEILSLKTSERKIVMRGGAMGRYLATSNGAGHLVYLHLNTLFAAPFDLGKQSKTAGIA